MQAWPAVLRDALRPLHPLLEDDGVTDILIDGADRVLVDHASRGRFQVASDGLRPRELSALVRFLARLDGSEVSGDHITVRLPDGSRVHAISENLAHRGQGPWLTIRRFRRKHLDGAALVAAGTLSQATLDRLIDLLVHHKRNIVVSGETGSGKTTLAEVLLAHLPPAERLLVLQDVEEIVPPTPAHCWGSFKPGEGGYGALLSSVLRMQPDRLALGECRGGEAWDLLEALTTGHSGGVTTVHARSPAVALRRLESMSLQNPTAPDLRAIRARVFDAVDVVVQVARGRGSDGTVVRRVTAVEEVVEEGLVGWDLMEA